LRVIGCPSFGLLTYKQIKKMEFKTEIKKASSSKAKLVFVKVPDAIEDLTVDNTRNELSGNLSTKTGFVDWFSQKIPDQILSFVGYSHKLKDEEIESIFSSRAEFYEMCNRHEILYNYSAYTGKWAVLAVD
jgi:hypothetical protein